MKVTTATLPYGVALDGSRIRPAGEVLAKYTLVFLEPVDGIESVTVSAPSLRDFLAVQKTASSKHTPGTQAFSDAVYYAHVERRCEPALTRKQIEALSGPDQDTLRALVEGGITPDNKRAHQSRAPGLEREAHIRLHFGADRKRVEQNLPTTKSDDPALYEAHLAHLVTRFGPLVVGEADFDEEQVPWSEFLNIPFADYVAISTAMAGRDYKDITEVLDGPVEVDGREVPFPGGVEPDAEEAPA